MAIMATMPLVLAHGDTIVIRIPDDDAAASASVVEVYEGAENSRRLAAELRRGFDGFPDFAGVAQCDGWCSYARALTSSGWVPIELVNGGPDDPSASPGKSDGPSAEPIPQAYSAALLAFASLPSPPWDRLASYARTIAALPPPGPIPIASAKSDLEAVLAQGAGGAWLGYVEGALYAAGGS